MMSDERQRTPARATLLSDGQALAAYLRARLTTPTQPGANARSLDADNDIHTGADAELSARIAQAARSAREAATLAPLFAIDNKPHLLFTVRSANLKRHTGEISFPGGSRDPNDATLAATALRETHEELGLPPQQVEVLGALPQAFVSVSGYLITPFVGWLGQGAPQLTPNPQEVAEVFVAPVAALADPAIYHSERWRRDGVTYTVHFYQFGEWRIWGATGRMLYTLLRLLPTD